MLERLSERVGPTGSLQGEGIANLLGRPPFDPLTLVIREAGQNIWDARSAVVSRSDRVPHMLVRVRTLTTRQSGVLRRLFDAGDETTNEPVGTSVLEQCLKEAGPIKVLEICDFGTTGLCGDTDPQKSKSKFVRFFFDIGSAHFDSGDGGTYGYGRSSLYLAGAGKAIVVDSLTDDDSNERRFMAARIGSSYERSTRKGKERFTGRHFWGRVAESGRVAPVVGSRAASLARALGMPDREASDSGTSVLIPWPELPAKDTARVITDIILHNLWPKLVKTKGVPSMVVEVELDGESIPLPDPARHPAYGLFATALVRARSRNPAKGAFPLGTIKPHQIAGHIAFADQSPRVLLGCDEDVRPERVFDRGVRHVALMRASELVVRYDEFPETVGSKEWAGVFLCDDTPAISRIFASSEPPAHDDWIPDRLIGQDASLVRVTRRRRIPEKVKELYGANLRSESGEPSKASLAGIADRFSSNYLQGDGSSADAESAVGGAGGKSKGAGIRSLRFLRLKLDGSVRLAVFSTGSSFAGPVLVRADVAIEGASADDVPADYRLPEVRGWTLPSGSFSEGCSVTIKPDGDYLLEVEFNGDYSITASLIVERKL